MPKPAYTDESGRQELEKKQAMLAAIVDSSEDAIISKTLQGMITSWNRGAEQMFGYTEAEVMGKHISILIPEDHLSEEDMIIDRIRHGLRVLPFQTVRQGKDGRLIPVSITVSPILSSDGTIIGASKIARDISEQLQAMKELKEHAQTQELLLSVSTALSAQLDLQTTLQKVTDIATQLTGAELGAFFYNRIEPEGEAYMLYTLAGASREAFEHLGMPRSTAVFDGTFSGEGIFRSDDITKEPRHGQNAPFSGMPEGHLPVVSYLAVPVNSPGGETIGGLFLGHSRPAIFTEEHEKLLSSITLQAGVAIENARLYEAIQQLNMRKDEFIGVAGHELRTPITTIKGYLQLLGEPSSEAVGKSFIEKALRQVNKLNRLVTDLLDVTKIQAGRLEYNMTTCFLLPLIRESVDMVHQIYSSHRIELQLPADDIVITADGVKIEQVVINFLTNAIKYSPVADRIALCVKKEEQRVVVAVRDWGIGIEQQYLESIFDRYYRVVSSEYVVGGLGIGLYIAHEIVQRHGGDIWVESEPGKGSVFYFSLPLPE
ncbi:PAS domain S-box protein [Puia sp.]|jgi:PAS domain S-box-containing protein|uniref:sensor histidine kinase n=1 Tax=Puia sp. TaxID=2045100 RepID=UPI002F414A9B